MTAFVLNTLLAKLSDSQYKMKVIHWNRAIRTKFNVKQKKILPCFK